MLFYVHGKLVSIAVGGWYLTDRQSIIQRRWYSPHTRRWLSCQRTCVQCSAGYIMYVQHMYYVCSMLCTTDALEARTYLHVSRQQQQRNPPTRLYPGNYQGQPARRKKNWPIVPIIAARDESKPAASENLIYWHDADWVEPVGLTYTTRK
jgi:hypothetical protein